MVTSFRLHSQCSGSVWPVWMYSSCSVACLVKLAKSTGGLGWLWCARGVADNRLHPMLVPRYGSKPCECALVHEKGITAVLVVEGDAVLLNVASFHPEAPAHRRIPAVSWSKCWRAGGRCALPFAVLRLRGVDPQPRSAETGEMQEQPFLPLPCAASCCARAGAACGSRRLQPGFRSCAGTGLGRAACTVFPKRGGKGGVCAIGRSLDELPRGI